MEESVTYQAIIRKGTTQGLHRALLREGQARFGPPDEQTRAAIEAITDLQRLEDLVERALRVANWQELLAAPRPKRRNGRKRKS